MSNRAKELYEYIKNFYREPAFGGAEDFVCGVVLQSIKAEGFTDDDIQELVDLGLIERYGTFLVGYKLTKKAIEEYWKE